jgi:uncharacterized membrane protein
VKRATSYLVAGLAAMLPTVATLYVLDLVFRILDGIGGRIQGYFGIRVPGLGALATIVIVFVLGVVATNVVGRRLVAHYDNLLQRIPVVKSVYATVKQLLELVAGPGKGAFRRVVLAEWPSQGRWAVGYLVAEESIEGLSSVFIPTSPNPATGFVMLCEPDKLKLLDMTLEEGMKFAVSCGLIGQAQAPQQENPPV